MPVGRTGSGNSVRASAECTQTLLANPAKNTYRLAGLPCVSAGTSLNSRLGKAEAAGRGAGGGGRRAKPPTRGVSLLGGLVALRPPERYGTRPLIAADDVPRP